MVDWIKNQSAKIPWPEIKNTLHGWLLQIGRFFKDYIFLLVTIAVLVAILLILRFAKKHMPSKGRIIDLYDKNGNLKSNKSEEIDDKINFRY